MVDRSGTYMTQSKAFRASICFLVRHRIYKPALACLQSDNVASSGRSHPLLRFLRSTRGNSYSYLQNKLALERRMISERERGRNVASAGMAGPSVARGFGTFLSHAGAQKRIFVDYVNRDLREVPGAHPFLDEFGLQSGINSWDQIERALAEAPVGALALSALGLQVSQLNRRTSLFFYFTDPAQRFSQVSSCYQRSLCGLKRRCASSAWPWHTGRRTARAGP